MEEINKKFINQLNSKDKELYKHVIDRLSKASTEEKEKFFIENLILTSGLIDTIDKIVSYIVKIDHKGKKLNREIKEIENSLSIGIPGWIKYTRKTKKTKK